MLQFKLCIIIIISYLVFEYKLISAFKSEAVSHLKQNSNKINIAPRTIYRPLRGTIIDRFPFLVEINTLAEDSDGRKVKRTCAGAIYGTRLIVTSIKCIREKGSNARYRVRVASDSNRDGFILGYMDIRVKEIKFKRRFPAIGNSLHGVAVVILKRPFPVFRGRIGKVCIDPLEEQEPIKEDVESDWTNCETCCGSTETENAGDEQDLFKALQLPKQQLFSPHYSMAKGSYSSQVSEVKLVPCEDDKMKLHFFCTKRKDGKYKASNIQEGAPLVYKKSCGFESSWTIIGIASRNYDPWSDDCQNYLEDPKFIRLDSEVIGRWVRHFKEDFQDDILSVESDTISQI